MHIDRQLCSCENKPRVRGKKAKVIQVKELTVKEKFIRQVTLTPDQHSSRRRLELIVPETPLEEQGLTLKEKLLRRSSRVRLKQKSL